MASICERIKNSQNMQKPKETPPPIKKKHSTSKNDTFQQGWDYIIKYMHSRDIPDWFRGTSNFQISAANNLYESLLFDMEQHTTHRVRLCISSLGLKPMITPKQITVLMKLSRGSDLAFLWFLRELHYKSDDKDYSVNEQIIMSAIAHLDTVTTLRELDRILPRNPPPEPKVPSKREIRVIVTHDHLKKHKIPQISSSPYYQPIKTPVLQKTKQTLKRPDLKISLAEYDVWENPNYIVRNESNRWFADYKPSPGIRVAHNIIKEEINRIFDDPDACREKAENPLTVCEYHKRMLNYEALLKTKLAAIARERCRRHFDVDGKKMERARSRVLTRLERDVKTIREKIRSSAYKKGKKPSIEVFEGRDSFRNCQVEDFEEECAEFIMENENNDEIKNEVSGETNSNEDDCSDSDEKGCNPISFFKMDSITCLKNIDNYTHKNGNQTNGIACSNAKKNNQNTKIANDQDEEDSDIDLDMHPVNRFFVAAKENQPWLFEYHNIFNIKHPFLEEPLNVKQTFCEALDSEMSLLTKKEGTLKPNIDKALKNGLKRDWTKNVNQYTIDNEPAVCPEILREEQIARDGEIVPLQFDREYFDPNDRAYMIYMLKRGFEFLKRKPKFVLAALPEAHKLPVFFYFIQTRFGKRYTYEERQKLYLQSMKILRALEKLTKTVPMPRIKMFSAQPFVSYGCRDYLLEKSVKIRQMYYDELDKIIMTQARVFWFAMRPYLCSSGPPRNTYFAYMPPRTVDITRFRQWKSSEFMDAKKEWDRRQRTKRTHR